MTIPDSIRRIILCLRTYQIAIPLIDVIPLTFYMRFAIEAEGGVASLVRPLLLPYFLKLLIWIFLIQFTVRGITARKQWSWVAALVILLFHLYTHILHQYYTFGGPLMLGYLDYLSDLQDYMAIIASTFGVYLLVQQNVRIEFAIDAILAKFTQKNGNGSK